MPEEQWVAELVREQLLAVTRDELPVLDRHSRHRVGMAPDPLRHHRRAHEPEGDGDRQGRQRAQGGRQLAGSSSRPGAFLELRVKVDQDWQRRPERVERLGYSLASALPEPAHGGVGRTVRRAVRWPVARRWSSSSRSGARRPEREVVVEDRLQPGSPRRAVGGNERPGSGSRRPGSPTRFRCSLVRERVNVSTIWAIASRWSIRGIVRTRAPFSDRPSQCHACRRRRVRARSWPAVSTSEAAPRPSSAPARVG